MKKVLLGTTALVAAGAFAGIGAAQAQDVMLPMKAGVGGYYNIALVATDVDDAMNSRGHGFQQNIEMEFQGETMLDNGLTAGVRIRINGNNSGPHSHDNGEATVENNTLGQPHTHAGEMGGGNNNIDETEVFFTGAFGALHLGMIEGAGYQTQIWAPGGGPIGGIKSSWFGGMAAWGDSGLMNDDSTKVLYFSPTFNGVSFAISYAPEDSTLAYAGDGDADSMADASQQSEQLAVAASYSADVMGGSFSANISHESHTTEAMMDGDMRMNCMGGAACDPSATRYGASVSIDDISLGVALLDAERTGGADLEAVDAGIGWSQGPLSLGISHGSVEEGKAEYDITALSGGYNLGPGIDVGVRASSGEAGGKGFTQLVLGTFFNF